MAREVKDTTELVKYEKHYSEDGFWDKIRKVAKKAGRDVIRMSLVLFYTLKSQNVDVKNKGIILGALGYFILPVDLIPDFIPVLGFTDDFTALMLALKAISDSVTPQIEAQADAKVAEWFD